MRQYNISPVFLCCAVMILCLKMGETSKANDYLLLKWRTKFRLLHSDDDGVICYEDMKSAREKFITLSNLKGKEKVKTSADFTYWFTVCYLFGEDVMTADRYVAQNREAYEADKIIFIEMIQKCESLINRVIDITDDGYISEEESILIMKALGHKNVDAGKEFFKLYHPVDNKVPAAYLQSYWTHFLTSDDETLPDIVMDAFKLLSQ